MSTGVVIEVTSPNRQCLVWNIFYDRKRAWEGQDCGCSIKTGSVVTNLKTWGGTSRLHFFLWYCPTPPAGWLDQDIELRKVRA